MSALLNGLSECLNEESLCYSGEFLPIGKVLVEGEECVKDV